jgi:aspartate kinase
LTDSDSFRRVAEVITLQPDRHIAVVSALGARNGEQKVTDLLYAGQIDSVLDRYQAVAEDLNCQRTLAHIDQLRGHLPHARSTDIVVSRGEWLSARILAEFMSVEFIDGSELIQVNNHQIHSNTSQRAANRLKNTSDRVIVPGFFGENLAGRVETLSRNGSDLSATVLARATRSEQLTLWKDVNGIYCSDPRFNPQARLHDILSFNFIDQNPSQVIHPDAASFIRGTSTDIVVRNVFNLDHPGTRISEAVAG